MQAALAKHGDVSKARGCQVDTSLNQFDGYSDHQRRDHLGRCVCPSSQGRYTSCAWPRGPRWSWRSSRRSWRQSRVERQGAKGRHSRDQGGRRQARRRTVKKQMQRPNDSFGFLFFCHDHVQQAHHELLRLSHCSHQWPCLRDAHSGCRAFFFGYLA
jgi:hypothetical protein